MSEIIGAFIGLLGFLMVLLAFIVPILIALDIWDIRSTLFSKASKIPGFQSGSPKKAATATFLYLSIAAVLCIGVGGMMVEAEGENLAVTDTALSDEDVYTGESFEIVGTVENNGTAKETFTVELRSGRTVLDKKEITLEAGQSRDVIFETQLSNPGEYTLEIHDIVVGTVTITENLKIADTTISSQKIAPGESVIVAGTIQNTGNTTATFSVDLDVNEELRNSQEVEIEAHEEQEVRFNLILNEPGNFDIALNDEDIGIVTVESEETPTPSFTPTSTPSPTATRTPSPTATTSSSTDEYYIEQLESSVQAEGITLEYTTLANGRDNGGQKAVITGYRSEATAASELESEMEILVRAFANTVEQGWDIDAMTVVTGEPDGTTAGTYAIEEEWVQTYLSDNISFEELMELVKETIVIY